MAPKIIKQKKLLISTSDAEEQNVGSRLAAVPDIPLRVILATTTSTTTSYLSIFTSSLFSECMGGPGGQ